jgi:Uma2 family endonuclease
VYISHAAKQDPRARDRVGAPPFECEIFGLTGGLFPKLRLDTLCRSLYIDAMITESKAAKKVWTEAELQALPEDGYLHEVVNGELVMSPKNDFYHGDICAELLTALRTHAKANQLGAVWDSSTGFWMLTRNCRAPEISFVSKERLVRMGFKRSTRKFFPAAPDLAVEVLSPNYTRAEIDERLKEFFAGGTRIAWVINPDSESVEVYQGPDKRKLLGVGADLEGEHLLPGLRYPIADLLKEWGWE